MESKQRADKACENTTSFFGLLGSEPNYILAADEYTKAGNSFRGSKAYGQAVECFIKAGECHQKLDSFFLAAKSYETAALVLEKNMDQFEKASSIYKKASMFYVPGGSPDKAGEILEKSAKVPQLSESNEGQAILTLLQAFETCSKELLDSVLKMGEVQYLDVEVAKLARGLTLPATPQNVQSAPDQLDGFHSHADLQEEIEEEGYL
ncbi:hypothetical protein HDV02_000068 [Globomyces sp. JEL0801]|nr:hypothetical protein HDV02_000068 [Globomyces sp. JEL0801]